MQHTSIYCPCCGETFDREWDEFVLSPDMGYREKCPNCGTIWFITIRFEAEEEVGNE